LVVDLRGGAAYREDRIQFAYSSTKGVAALCLALLIEQGLLDPDSPVADYWPEFAAAGKQDIPVRWLLSHQAGLISVDGGYTLDEYVEHNALAERLAAQAPAWAPGSGHGYHALTWGTLVDELTRRVAKLSLGEFYDAQLREPDGVDFFLGLPAGETDRVTYSVPPDADADDPERWPTAELAQRALQPGPLFPSLTEIEHNRRARSAALPAVSGVGSARGLATLYALCTTGIGGPPKLSAATTEAVATEQVRGPDLVLPFETSFGLGFQTPNARLPLAGIGSFGHDGFAGSLGLASPAHRLAFGFFTNQIPAPYGGADPAATELVNVLVSLGT
jgi:CubicO group peptidase (beta-lactamase class C family)